nr:MAG TPA: Helper component proteinase [Bacteriophage sp.]
MLINLVIDSFGSKLNPPNSLERETLSQLTDRPIR